MGQIIFNTFQLFTDIPVNIWPWLFLLSAPLLVFSANPHHGVKWRVGRIFIAVAIGYVLVNLTLHTHRALQWKAKDACEKSSVHRQDSIEMFDECNHLVNTADGASNVFYLVLGWVPAGGYVGFWELFWRRKHRSAIKAMGNQFTAKWFSTLVVIGAIPVWLSMLLVQLAFIYYRINCTEYIIATDTCWIYHPTSPAP